MAMGNMPALDVVPGDWRVLWDSTGAGGAAHYVTVGMFNRAGLADVGIAVSSAAVPTQAEQRTGRPLETGGELRRDGWLIAAGSKIFVRASASGVSAWCDVCPV